MNVKSVIFSDSCTAILNNINIVISLLLYSNENYIYMFIIINYVYK